MEMLLELVTDVWTEGGVPTDWNDAVLTPEPMRQFLDKVDSDHQEEDICLICTPVWIRVLDTA